MKKACLTILILAPLLFSCSSNPNSSTSQHSSESVSSEAISSESSESSTVLPSSESAQESEMSSSSTEEPFSCKVVFDLGYDDLVSEIEVGVGQKLDKPADPEREGYDFAGWVDEEGNAFDFDNIFVEGDLRLIAVWQAKTYEVRFLNDDGSLLAVQEGSYGEKAVYDGPKPVSTKSQEGCGFVFSGWDQDLTIKGDMTFLATYFIYSLGLTIENGVVRGYSGEAEEIWIPAVWDEKAVKEIGDRAFEGNERIRSVHFPDSLLSFGVRAFYGCISLGTLTIPEGVEILKENSLALCDVLLGVLLPRSLKTIETGVFANDYSMVSILYAGSKEDWEKIELASDPGYGYYWSTLYYYSETPRYDGSYWWYQDGDVATHKDEFA